MKTWDDWSDSDLSEAIAPYAVGGRRFNRRYKGTAVECFGSAGTCIGTFDINNWADMGPLCFSYGISVINLKGTTQWFACTDVEFDNICLRPDGEDNGVSCFNAEHVYYQVKPTRAAAIVFLMMNGVRP